MKRKILLLGAVALALITGCADVPSLTVENIITLDRESVQSAGRTVHYYEHASEPIAVGKEVGVIVALRVDRTGAVRNGDPYSVAVSGATVLSGDQGKLSMYTSPQCTTGATSAGKYACTEGMRGDPLWLRVQDDSVKITVSWDGGDATVELIATGGLE